MRWMIWLALVLVAALAPAAHGAPSSTEALARVRAAVGYERLQSQASGVVARGTARYRGLDSKFTFLFTPDNRYRSEIAGPLGRIAGFNGTVGWEVDSTRMPRVLELEDLEVEQFRAWIHAGRWMASDGPFAVTLDATKTDEQRVALSLKLKGGLLEATVFVDRATWLPQRVTRRSPAGEEIIELTDYREALGFRFPRRLTRTLGGVTTVFDVSSVAANQIPSLPLFEPVTARPADTSWDTSAPARVEAQRMPSGHILVHPLVNGKDVGWFLLDTGAGGMVIDTKAAERLAMPALGETVVVGAVASRTGKLAWFELGGHRFENLEVELAAKSGGFSDPYTVGNIGVGVLCRFRIIFDFGNKRVAFVPRNAA